MAQNLISAIAWVSRGYAIKQPKEFDIDEEEINKMKQDKLINKNLTQDLGKIQEQDEDSSGDNLPVFCQDLEMHGKQQLPDDGYPVAIEDLSDEEKEDYQIKSSDALVIAAKIENEFSSLEVYIYEEEKANLFVHHEIQLSAFPLAVEWLPIQPGQIESTSATKGNYAIVSSFLPEIEIWNLDVVNVLEPSVVLGGEIEQNYKKVKNLKKQNKKSYKVDSHTDSVLSLSLNSFKPNILLSGSADHTVKLWDLMLQKCVFTYNHHKDKVQISKFNTKEESVILSGGEDGKLCLFDARSPDSIHQHKMLGSLESACWDPIKGYQIAYSTEDGNLILLDARKIGEQPLANFNVNKKALSSVHMSTGVPGLLATTCLDGKIRVYDTDAPIKNGQLQLISSYNPKLESLYCGQFYQDSPWTYGCGSSQGELFVWDMQESQQIVSHFSNRVAPEFRPKVEDCTNKNTDDLCMKEREEIQKMEQEDKEDMEEGGLQEEEHNN
ncbi:unnamed protein product [Paramecium sonneborni]|uniref:Uncharacterized protein n=1 Tax=Paramecium sonneborni TaxID=65129 RepID=A0A8S1PPP0_9CILI|nr:unnamed protein product [Paramecium sonneborni]